MIPDLEPLTLTLTDPIMIKAVEYLQTGNYFLVSWHDFKLVACVLFSAGAIFGYCLANADLIKEKIRSVAHG